MERTLQADESLPNNEGVFDVVCTRPVLDLAIGQLVIWRLNWAARPPLQSPNIEIANRQIAKSNSFWLRPRRVGSWKFYRALNTIGCEQRRIPREFVIGCAKMRSPQLACLGVPASAVRVAGD